MIIRSIMSDEVLKVFSVEARCWDVHTYRLVIPDLIERAAVIIRCFRVSAFVLRPPRLCKVGNEGDINTVFRLLVNKVGNFFVCLRNYGTYNVASGYLFSQLKTLCV